MSATAFETRPGSDAPTSGEKSFRAVQLDELARGLGWFSIGLGACQVLAPEAFSKLIGLKERDLLVPAMGFRELATGVGILKNGHPTEWLWARFAGDVVDLGLIATAALEKGTNKPRLLASALVVAGCAAVDFLCAQQLNAHPRRRPIKSCGEIDVRKSITVNATADELYRFWRDFANLPRTMRYLTSVTILDGARSKWVAPGPAGTTVEWEAELTEDRPNERIAWRSIPNAMVSTEGAVEFRPAPANRGTTLTVALRYRPIGGAAGALFAFLFGKEPAQQIADDLRAFKSFIETGEVHTIQGQSSGRGRD